MPQKGKKVLEFIWFILMLIQGLFRFVITKNSGRVTTAVSILEFASFICLCLIVYIEGHEEKNFFHYILDSLKDGLKSSLLFWGSILLFIGSLTLMFINGWPALIAFAVVIIGIIFITIGYKSIKYGLIKQAK